MDLMRKRARERDDCLDEVELEPTRKEAKVAPSPDASGSTERGHINFFADIKQGVGHKLYIHPLLLLAPIIMLLMYTLYT